MREVWYPANRDRHKKLVRARSLKLRAELQVAIRGLKEDRGCIDCGIDDFRVLDFDHVSGKKRFSICKAVAMRLSLTEILAEISKCEVRCANCHRIVTFNRNLLRGTVNGRRNGS